MDSYTLVEIPSNKRQNTSDTDIALEYMQIAETNASTDSPSHLENSNTLSQSIQAEFDITLCSVTHVKKHRNPCKKWCMVFFIFSMFGVSLILLGATFDIWVRMSVTAILNYFLKPLTTELMNTRRVKKSVPNVIPKTFPVYFSPWLIGLELSLTIQPFVLKEQDIYQEVNKTNESIVLALKIEDRQRLRLYIDPIKSSKAGFTAQFKNVNAPKIILSHVVHDLVKTTVSDNYLQELLFNLIISKTNISDQAVPVQSLQDIVKDLNVLDNFAEHIPNKYDQETVKTLMSFIIENDDMDMSLVYHSGVLSLVKYNPPILANVNDIGSYFDMPSIYTLPGTNFTCSDAKNSSWHGIQTWKYIKPYQIPKSILGYIPEYIQKFPLSVSEPNSDPTKNITEILTYPSVQYSTGDPLISFNNNHHHHLSISLEVHSTLNIPVSATAYVQVSVKVPDANLYGSLGGKTIPYMLIQLSLSQLPGWLMAFYQVFCYFRLGFIVILVSSGVALIVITFIFTTKASTEASQEDGEDECEKGVHRFLCIFASKCTCKLQTIVNES